MYTVTPDVNPAIVSDTESDDEGDTDGSFVVEWFQPSKEASAPVPPFVSAPPPAVDAAKVVNPPTPIPSGFDLGASLIYIAVKGLSETVVFEGAMPDCLHHTIRRKDGTKLNVHDFHLRLKHQPDLSNIPSTPLKYCKEVRCGITKEEAQQLAHP
jgi:hypothetical protein